MYGCNESGVLSPLHPPVCLFINAGIGIHQICAQSIDFQFRRRFRPALGCRCTRRQARGGTRHRRQWCVCHPYLLMYRVACSFTYRSIALPAVNAETQAATYRSVLNSELFQQPLVGPHGSSSPQGRTILSYNDHRPKPTSDPYSSSPLGAETQRVISSPQKQHRKIPKLPFKVPWATRTHSDRCLLVTMETLYLPCYHGPRG